MNSILKIGPGIVENILSISSEGRQFEKSIDRGIPLNSKQQKRLRNILLGHFLDSGMVLSKNEIEKLSQDIVVSFPKEDSRSYFNPYNKTGPLYVDHNNKVQQLRKSQVLPQSTSMRSSKKRKLSISNAPFVGSFAPNDLQFQSDEIIKMNSETNYSEFIQHWRNSSEIRLNKLQNLNKDQKITDFLQEYAAYKRADGSTLVSLSFNTFIQKN